MTALQRAQLKQSELRTKINDELEKADDEKDLEALASLTDQMKGVEVEVRAALVAEGEQDLPEPTTETPEDHQLTELRERVDFGRYLAASLAGSGVMVGPEAELNQELGLPADHFPLDLLDGGEVETRAAHDAESNVNQGTWLDRVLAMTAASRLGISMRSVSPGVASYPVTTQGGGGVQRGRTEAVAESTYNFAITEIKPTRAAVAASYETVDDARLPGLADAIRRDLRAGMVEAIDRKIFLGDAGATGTEADIVGLNTAAIQEVTLTQANKVKPAETLAAFLGMVDGIYANSLEQLNVVATVGANVLWGGTIANSAAENQTVAGFLRAAGLSWTTRGEIEAATGNGKFGAFVGLQNGIEGAGISAVWNSGQLIRDIFTQARSGSVLLTLNYLHGLKFPRTANFKRVKFVT